jgi:hypothetical protein
LFEIEHCETKAVRGIEDLLKELECFQIVYGRDSLDQVLETLDNEIKWKFESFTTENFRGDCKVDFEMALIIKQRFVRRPNTFEECKKPATYEIGWYDWNFPKCANCANEFNLYQCVNKSECQHICCLNCFFQRIVDEPSQCVTCPICFSYYAGTLERYQCKTVIPRENLVLIWFAVTESESMEEALEGIMENRLWLSDKVNKEACMQLVKQPFYYQIFKNLNKFELSVSMWKDVFKDEEK